MKTVKVVKIATALLLVMGLALFLHKNLPRTAVVQITGTDVKRVDSKSGKHIENYDSNQQNEVAQTHDVRYINTVQRNNEVMVFRNEDSGWGWPPYFKFNSADVTAQAQAFATAEERPWVLVKYYGWRIRMLSMFPNVVGFKVVDKDYTYIPWFNILFLGLLLAMVIYVRFKFKKLVQWLRGKQFFPHKKIRRNQESAAS